jgi:hypothetical protein
MCTNNENRSNREFQRDLASFEQNHKFQGDLLRLATQILLTSITVNGGLLLIIGGRLDFPSWLNSSLLFGAALINIAIIYMLYTIEKVMNRALEKIEEFNPRFFPSMPRVEDKWVYKLSVIRVFSILLILISIFHVIIAIIQPFGA